MKRLLLPLALCGVMSACAHQSATTDNHESQEANDSVLIVYYSQEGSTRAVAKELSSRLHCDIEAIEPVKPYDGDYDSTVARWLRENESGEAVAIKPLNVDLSQYSTIFLGFPIWGGTYALPVATFLAENSLAGKKIVTFATFGSGGIANATADVAATQPGADVRQGYGVRAARIDKMPQEIGRFMIENGYEEGEIDPLPDFSKSRDVTPQDIEIFNEACADYKFPLGTPQTVAVRSLKEGEEFKFEVNSKTPDGRSSQSTIYVIAAPGRPAEFTEVIRH